MNVIARDRGTGKTRELLTLADENNGQVLTTNKRALQAKADAYGLFDLHIIDWNDMQYGEYDAHKPLYIHKADDVFAEFFDNLYELRLNGMSVTTGE